MTGRSAIRYNYQDYLAVPEDSRRHEIVDGELFVTPSPRFRHQEVVTNLAEILRRHVRGHGLGKIVVGPVTVRLHDELVVEPDLIFVGAERLEIVDPEGGVDGPPDLVIEVLSPSNLAYDRTLKRKHYMDNGISELWIVDADQHSIEVWRPGREEAELARDLLEWRVGDLRLEIRLEDVLAS